MTKIFLEKSCTEWGGKTSTRPFYEKLKLNISLVNSLKFYTVCFYCMPNGGLSKYIEIKLQTACFYLVLRFFKK